MSKSSHDKGSRGSRREGKDQSDSGPERRGMHPEDEKLISKPVSRQDEMMRVAIAGFLGLFVVSMALAQSRQTPEPIPEPQFTPVAPALPPLPEIVELLPPPPVAPMRASGDNRLYGRVVTRGAASMKGTSAGTGTRAVGPIFSTRRRGCRLATWRVDSKMTSASFVMKRGSCGTRNAGCVMRSVGTGTGRGASGSNGTVATGT